MSDDLARSLLESVDWNLEVLILIPNLLALMILSCHQVALSLSCFESDCNQQFY